MLFFKKLAWNHIQNPLKDLRAAILQKWSTVKSNIDLDS